MNFEHHMNSEKLEMDESPFIHLTANPKLLDVLCVTCYECVKFEDVNKHSKVCSGKPPEEPPSNNDSLNIAMNLKKLYKKPEDDKP